MGKLTEAQKAAIRRWDADNLMQIAIRVPKDLGQKFKDKCQAEGVSQASVIKEAMEKFLGK